MDVPPPLVPGVRRLTVNIDSDDVALFEETWPVPDGISVHSYLVQGDQAVLIDPWDAGGYGPEELAVDLADLGLTWTSIHAVAFTKEPAPDLVERIRAFHPAIVSLGCPNGASHQLGSGLSLRGDGGVWALPEAGVVFSGDAFSGLGWVEDETWFEELKEDEARYFDDGALRWFATRPWSIPGLPTGTRFVLPAHGCAFRDPSALVSRFHRFQEWAGGPGLDEITVVWPDDDDEGAEALVGGGLDAGAGLNLFRVPGDHPTLLAAGARKASLVVVAEGLDFDFLAGLTKEVWRPSVGTPAAELRSGLKDRYLGLP